MPEPVTLQLVVQSPDECVLELISPRPRRGLERWCPPQRGHPTEGRRQRRSVPQRPGFLHVLVGVCPGRLARDRCRHLQRAGAKGALDGANEKLERRGPAKVVAWTWTICVKNRIIQRDGGKPRIAYRRLISKTRGFAHARGGVFLNLFGITSLAGVRTGRGPS